MIRNVILTALAILTPLALATPQAPRKTETKTYAVVVNAKNRCNQTDKQVKATLKKLFLKRLSKWPGGETARPYGRSKGPEMSAFIKQVLGMGEAELARHWLKVKNMNGTTPPKEVRSARMVLKFIAKHEGAFGIVKIEEAKSAAGVKILYRF